MREAIAFCLSMMLAGLLFAEVRFGGMRSPKSPKARGARSSQAPDRKPPGSIPPPPPNDSGTDAPDAGKPAPLLPRPGHHLVAANALPPANDVYLLPKD